MFSFFKKLFSTQEESIEPEPPGRTFNRIITSKYFGCADENTDTTDSEHIASLKQSKIDQIKELKLKPKFLRYHYKEGSDEIESAHVAFQKEVSSQRGSMIHVTELSFIVKRHHFEELEKMANISLKNDFRDLTNYQYTGEERRKEKREEA